MAFSFTYFQRVESTISLPSSDNPTVGQATGQRPTIWTYNGSSTGSNESAATIEGANYFLGASGYLSVGDWILINSNDPGYHILNVTAVTAGTTVTTSTLV